MTNKLKGFKYQKAELSDSHWKQQRSELVETYLGINDDDLLHYFRQLAGITDQAQGLVGWYGINGGTFGQKLGAFVRLYLVTGEERLKEKAVRLADGWGECVRASQALTDVNDTYVYDKLMGGFLDMYEFLHYEPAKSYIYWLTESAMQRFRRDIKRDGLQDEGLEGMIEWYTLPEQLYRAYLLTGEQMYLSFAKEWDYPYYWEKLIKGEHTIGPRHAYSHVNCLSSALMAYQVLGEKKYLQAAMAAYKEILSNHTFATGGYGPAECLFADEEGYLGDSLKANWDRSRKYIQYRNFAGTMSDRDDAWGSCEVSCCSWAVFKLCNYLMCITGDAGYGDWAEKLLYNGCGGQPPVTKDGKVMYYADYFVNGGIKSVEDRRLQDNGTSFEWQCCTGTFPQDVAEYSNMLYYYDDKGIYVSQYLASSVSFRMGEADFILENHSFYPKEKELRFRVRGDQKGKFRINFRVPSWAVGNNRISVNGKIVETDIRPNTWLSLERCWSEGDLIELTYEFKLRFEPVDEFSPEIAALCYGPVTLVCDKMTVFEGNMEEPETWIEPIQKDGYSFAFRTKPGHVRPFPHLTRQFYPYYEVPLLEWYYMYNRVL